MALYLLCSALLAHIVSSSPVAAYPSNGVAWRSCEQPPLPPTLQCANFTVPVNWDAPGDGQTINLFMARLPRPSNSTAERIGHLFVNPGGPGGSAVEMVAVIAGGAYNVPSELLDRFDIIGVDPRGVGLSGPTMCDGAIWKERVSLFPKTKEEYDRLVDKNRRLGESCIEMTGGVVNYLDTISAARDLEAVRAALGEKMNWLGTSYGSQLGAQYAELFPDNVRAMVFDGILQHSQADSSNILIEGTAYATALESFFAWASKHDSSPLRGQDVEKLWYSILENATSSPIPAPDCKDACRRDVNAEEIRLNAQAFLTSATDPARMMFADALQQASKGNASLLSTQFPDSHNPFGFAGLAIGCQDWPSRAPSFADFQAKMRIGELFAPLNNGASQTWTLQASCVGWPAPPRNPPAKLKVKTKNPILMVQSTRDPSSSYAWAAGMMEEIENHVLLMRNGDGHTSWAQFPATTDAINQFLISLEPPAPGTVLEE